MLKIERIPRAGDTSIKLIGLLETESLPELKALIETSGPAVVLEMDHAGGPRSGSLLGRLRGTKYPTSRMRGTHMANGWLENAKLK